MIVTIILLLVSGIAAGLLAGLFGLGGGILFTPVLLFIFQYAGIPDPVLWTVGTSLLCNFTAALSSSVKHYQIENLFIYEGLMIGIFGVAGTFIGRLIATSSFYTEREFIIFFSLILLNSVYYFLRKKKTSLMDSGVAVKKMRLYHALSIGTLSGIIATLAGVGGGLVLVPGMAILLSYGFRKAVSISSMAIVFITLSGWIQLALLSPETGGYSDFYFGYVDFGLAFPLIIASFIGARYGVKLLSLIRLRTLEIIFGCIILLVVGRLIAGLF